MIINRNTQPKQAQEKQAIEIYTKKPADSLLYTVPQTVAELKKDSFLIDSGKTKTRDTTPKKK